VKRFEAEIDWIGDWPISHCERDRRYGDVDYLACLCGEEDYMVCFFEDGGIMNLTIHTEGTVSDPDIEWPR